MVVGTSVRNLVVTLAAASLVATECIAAQGAPPAQPANAQPGDVVVRGRRTPAAEAPRWATCAEQARDPIFAARLAQANGDPSMMPTMYLPTRMPRNPDYRAPPRVPAGSALPELPANRFSLDAAATDTSRGIDPALFNGSDSGGGYQVGVGASSVEQARLNCIKMFSPFSSGIIDAMASDPLGDPSATSRAEGGFFGSSGSLPRRPTRSTDMAAGRAEVVNNDRTLPMAFALFDQGRYAESLDWFRKASRALDDMEGGDEARLFIGKLTMAGFAKGKTPADGIKALKNAADANFNPLLHMPAFNPDNPALNTASGEAAMILAAIYRRGMPGVAPDMNQAIRWYKRAEAVGHVAAGKILGDIYFRGTGGVPKDVKKAMQCYERAGKLDLPSAQVAMGQILEFGDTGIPADPTKAMAWYTAAAKHEEPEALYALALAYDEGKGVTANPDYAFGYFKRAAVKGLPAALVAIGTYFQDGSVVKRDDAMARRWFESGARAGDSDGMYNLAALLANGRGGDRDIVGSWVWMKRAAKKGHAGAMAALPKVEQSMSPQQRQDAAAKLATT